VEMRLRQEFRLQNRKLAPRKVAVWALAAAAGLVMAVSWKNWRNDHEPSARQDVTRPNIQENTKADVEKVRNQEGDGWDVNGLLLAGNELGDFTVLPGAVPLDSEEASILRVRMQRGALSAYGLPVNEERAGEWIQVDLLVGDDGVPQAVRLPN
jgi:hypothetical protein